MDDRTKDELYERATELDIQGRSDMNKDELARAIAEEEDGTPATPTSGPVSPLTPPAPAPADQPGVGRPANAERDPSLGPVPNVSASRIGEAIRRRRSLREESLSE